MKLQKLLKKLALPVFALAVVGMLAACSSPSGGGSGSGAGGNNLPALNSDTEYTISFDDSITDVDKAVLLAKDIKAGDKVTGAEVEAEKAELTAAGYTYEVNGTMLILKKKTTSSSDAHKDEGEGHKPQGGESGGNTGTTTGGKYKIEDELLGTMTVIAGNDGTYVVKAQGMTVEEGKYVLNGDKVTTTTTKELNEAFELVSVTKPTTTTYTIGANNVLTEYKGSSGTGTGTGTSQSGGSTNTETIDGTYEGTITGAGNSLYASVEISGKTYSVKMWTSSAKTGNPIQTSSGTVITTQKTVKGMMFGGTGTDHTFTAQPNGNNGWTVTIILNSGSSYSGTITKGSSGSQGGKTNTDVTPVNPNNPGTTIPDGELPFDTSDMYLIMYGNEQPVPVSADYVDDILKGLSASDYDKDDTNKTITLKNATAAQTAMSNYESVMKEAMLAAGYEPMED